MAKASDYREMDDTALKTTLDDLNSEYFDLKFQTALSKLENISLVKQKRRDIARVKTIMTERASQGKGK